MEREPHRLRFSEMRTGIVIGPKMIDRNNHASNVKQIKPLGEERCKFIQRTGYLEEYLKKHIGKDPFVSHVHGVYKQQMRKDDYVNIFTNVEIKSGKMFFNQRYADDLTGRANSEFHFTAPFNSCPEEELPPEESDEGSIRLEDKLTVMPEWLNENRFMTVDEYLAQCEKQRDNCFDNFIFNDSVKEKLTKLGLIAVVTKIEGDMLKRKFSENTRLSVRTTVKDKFATLIFTQSFFENGDEISRFRIEEAFMNREGKPVRIPTDVAAKFNQ